MDGLYRSINGGTSWTKIHSQQTPISVLLRRNGELVVATASTGAVKSVNGGPWIPLVNAPHISCLAENTAGEVWACTANFGSPSLPADGFGIMKTTDLATWTGVARYQDIKEPVACPTSTVQYQKCDRNPNLDIWCGLCTQLGCDPKRECPSDADGPPGDGLPPSDKKGCCQSGGEAAPGAVALGGVVFVVLRRRRRRTL
jgi:uncharacterized protein (TIGR03382 family)